MSVCAAFWVTVAGLECGAIIYLLIERHVSGLQSDWEDV